MLDALDLGQKALWNQIVDACEILDKLGGFFGMTSKGINHLPTGTGVLACTVFLAYLK